MTISMITLVSLICDFCSYELEMINENQAQAWADEKGWATLRDGVHCCPECIKKGIIKERTETNEQNHH